MCGTLWMDASFKKCSVGLGTYLGHELKSRAWIACPHSRVLSITNLPAHCLHLSLALPLLVDSQAGVVVGKVSKYCVVGLVLNKEGMYEVAKATELCKRFMMEKVRRLVDSCNGRPRSMSYSSDGTPLHTRIRLHIEVVGQQTSRSGGASKEFLCFPAVLLQGT